MQLHYDVIMQLKNLPLSGTYLELKKSSSFFQNWLRNGEMVSERLRKSKTSPSPLKYAFTCGSNNYIFILQALLTQTALFVLSLISHTHTHFILLIIIFLLSLFWVTKYDWAFIIHGVLLVCAVYIMHNCFTTIYLFN